MMKIRFNCRAVCGMVLFISIIPALLYVSLLADGLRGDWRFLNFFGCFIQLGGATFWLVLLMPCWGPYIRYVLANAEVRPKDHRPLLNLIPAAWYCVLLCVPWNPLIGSACAVIGSIVAFAILFSSLKGSWRVLSVPLGFAILSGMVWLFVGN